MIQLDLQTCASGSLDVEQTLCLACDASMLGGGHVLFQVPKGCDKYIITKTNIVAISSHKFTEVQQRYSIYKKELWSCVFAMRRHHNYLWGKRFVLITDHFPLIYLKTQPALSQALQQWLDILQDYDFAVIHRPGVLHVLPDVLSRLYNEVNKNAEAWGVYSNEQLLDALKNHLMKGSDYWCVESIASQQVPKKVADKLATTRTGGGKKYANTLRYSTVAAAAVSESMQKFSADQFADFETDENDCQHVFTVEEEREIRTAQHAECLTGAVMQKQDNIEYETLGLPLSQLEAHPTYDEYYDNVLTPVQQVAAEVDQADNDSDEEEEVEEEGDKEQPKESEADQLRIALERRGMQAPPEDERLTLIQEQHSKGHFGEIGIYRALFNRKLWWPKMRENIKQVVQECRPCMQNTVMRGGWHPARSLHASLPGDVMYADIAELPLARDGLKYLLVLVDAFTMFVYLIALESLDAEVVARAFFTFWCDFGVYKILHTDNASTFQNMILRALAHLLGSKQSFSIPYLPQTSPAEPVISNVKQRIVRTLHGCEKEWPLFYKAIQLYINMQIKEKHGSVPYSLMFGRAPNELTDYTKKGMELLELAPNTEDWKKHQEKVISLIFPTLDLRMRRFSEQYIERLNKMRMPILIEALAPGMPVLVKNPLYLNNNEHTRPMTTPPYLPDIHYVVSRAKSGAYMLRNEIGELIDREVPLSQLKLLRSRNIPKLGESDVWVVDKIVDRRGRSPVDAEYRIRWKGYRAKDDTWEPADHIIDKRLLTDYNNTHPFPA